MKYLYLFSIALTSLSCTKEVDRKDYQAVAELTYRSIVSHDTATLNNLLTRDTSAVLRMLRNDMIDDLKTFKSQNSVYIMADTTRLGRYKNRAGRKKIALFIYFRIDSSIHEASVNCELDSIGNISVNNLFINNLSEECTRFTMTPYAPPNQIVFRRFISHITNSRDIYKYGRVELLNEAKHDVNYIKFRVSIRNNGITFFSQTVEFNETIYKGDFKTVDIPGLSNFYTGFKIRQENLSYDGEILELRPKPSHAFCDLIHKLEQLSLR